MKPSGISDASAPIVGKSLPGRLKLTANGFGSMRRMRTSSTSPGSAPFTKIGPVIECGPPPGFALRSSTTCSIVAAGLHLVVRMHHGLDRDRVAGVDGELRRLARIEPAPLHRLERRRQRVVLARRRLRRPVVTASRCCRLLRDDGAAGQCGGDCGDEQRAFDRDHEGPLHTGKPMFGTAGNPVKGCAASVPATGGCTVIARCAPLRR